MGRGRRIRLSFPAAGASVTAELLEEEAPQVAGHIWSLLPLERRAIHGQYSGPRSSGCWMPRRALHGARTWCGFLSRASCCTSTTTARAQPAADRPSLRKTEESLTQNGVAPERLRFRPERIFSGSQGRFRWSQSDRRHRTSIAHRRPR
ncbi:MAG: DUF3830 family protein [Acidobacteria bacterium]|nr:DUF3830 family protein [Acidobacteriota bacterium]